MQLARSITSDGALLRLFAVATALTTALALAAAPVGAQSDDQAVTPARVAGETRFETAAQIATLTFDEAEAAIVVTGQDFSDALAASFPAGSAVAPVLLVAQDQVPRATWDALEDLGVEDVVLLGGTAAISLAVEAAFDESGYDTARIAGASRYETAAAVARTYGELVDVGTLDGERTAFLASGEQFPDALSVGPLAASANMPLLLTPRAQASPTADQVLDELDIGRVVVVGGAGAVSSGVVEHYQDLGYEVERFAGETRTETAVVVAQNAIERFEGFSASLVLLGRGDDYPDALAASIHGAANGAPILLTANPAMLSPSTEGHLFDLCPAVEAIRALGGTGAVSVQALSEAVTAAGRCHEDGTGDPRQSYIVSPQGFVSAAPGHEQQFALVGDEEAVAGATELALFPCEGVTFAEGDGVFFRDSNEDGFADRPGESETGAAWISRINDVPQSGDQTRDRAVTGVGYTWHVSSNAVDCTISVVWEGGDHGHELPVDADGAPTVRFGAGGIEWTGDEARCSAADLEGEVAFQEGLPAPVIQTRAAIAETAVACDYDRLVDLAGDEFTYSFGAAGDPAGHWRRLEDAGEEPIAYLRELLDRPYGTIATPQGTQYVWPSAFAYDDWADLPPEDREALRPLYGDEDFEFFETFGGYIGYRVGIDADGDWRFFVAGD